MRTGAVGFVLGIAYLGVLITCAAPIKPPPMGHPKYNCTRVGFKNSPPKKYYGALVCDVKVLALPPTQSELNNIYNCLKANDVEFVPDMTGWSYYTASDIVVYPSRKPQIILGVTITPEKAIYLRETYGPESSWPTLQRGALYHEIIHAVRPGPEEHDEVFYLCTKHT